MNGEINWNFLAACFRDKLPFFVKMVRNKELTLIEKCKMFSFEQHHLNSSEIAEL